MKYFLYSIMLLLFFNSCIYEIKDENKLIILAKKTRKPSPRKGCAFSIIYVFKNKIYRDGTSMCGDEIDYDDHFLIYVDQSNPIKWDRINPTVKVNDKKTVVKNLPYPYYFNKEDLDLLIKTER